MVSQGFPVIALVFDPQISTTLYAGLSGSGILKSTDDGGSWFSKGNGLLPYPSIASITINPINPDIVYAEGVYGVWKTTNGGDLWVRSINGIPPSSYVSSLAIDPTHPDIVYAGTNIYSDFPAIGIYQSFNGGATWHAFNSGLTNPLVTTLMIDPTRPATLYAGTFGSGVFVRQPLAFVSYIPNILR